jgi:hypothetical protein
MPTVPTTFVPQVAPQAPGDIGQFQAPGVQAAENLAGPQLARFGQAMTGAGNAAFRLGSAIQDGIDDATTKQADVMGTTAMQRVADRFLGTVGQQSERDFEAAMGELSQAGSAAMGTLQNDTQRAMFAPILARNMGMFQSRMQQHRNGQVRVWNTNEAIARSEVNADNAIFAWASRNEKDAAGRPVGMLRYAAYADTAVDEARKAGELMGYAPDSAQMKQLEQKVHDRMAKGIVDSMLVNGEYAAADEFLSDPDTQEMLDARAAQALRESVMTNQQRAVIGELTASIKETGTLYAKSDPKTYGQEATEGAEPPATLRDALERAESIKDDDVRKAVQAQLRTQYAQDEALRTQEYRALIDAYENHMAVPGNSMFNLPPALESQMAALSKKDLQSFYTQQVKNTSLFVQEDLARNPGKLTRQYLEQHRHEMTHEMYIRLLGELNQPEKIIEAQVDADDINRQLTDMGMSQYVNAPRGSTDAQRHLIFRNNITQMIEIRQRESGGKISPDEKRDIIRKAIVDEAYVSISWARDPRIPVAMMTQEELGKAYYDIGDQEVPFAQYRMAEQQLMRAGIASPTEAQILEYWTRKGKPK